MGLEARVSQSYHNPGHAAATSFTLDAPRAGPQTVPLMKKPIAVPRVAWMKVSQYQLSGKISRFHTIIYRLEDICDHGLPRNHKERSFKSRQRTHGNKGRKVLRYCRPDGEQKENEYSKVVSVPTANNL